MENPSNLTDGEVNKLVEMLKDQGGPTDDDMLLMAYHAATAQYAADNPHLQHLHTITKARFVAKYGDVIQTMRNIHEATQRDHAATGTGGGAVH